MRKIANPLFPKLLDRPSDTLILDAQRRDHEELIAFVSRLRELVQEAVDLRPNAESQVVLDLKAKLDQSYEQACGLAEDQTGNKDAIRQLIAVIMSTIRRSAGADAIAARELDDEEEARRQHFRLLAQPLVADLLAPESPIQPQELVPTLLSESEAAVRNAAELFDEAQLVELCREGRRLLERVETLPHRLQEAPERLALMERRLADLAGPERGPAQ